MEPIVLTSTLDPCNHHLQFMNAQQHTIIHACDRLQWLIVEVSEESDSCEKSTNVSLDLKEPEAKKPQQESALGFLLGDSLEGSSTFRSP